MPELHLKDFIAQHSDLELKENTVRKWLASWGDKPSNGILSESQQSLILAYVENVSSGQMSQADFVQRVQAQQLQEQADQYQSEQFAVGVQFAAAERQARINDGIVLGQEFARDFMAGIDAGFSSALPRLWNERMNNQNSPYRLANQLIHQKLQELRAGDAKRFNQRLQATPFAVDPAGLLGAGDE